MAIDHIKFSKSQYPVENTTAEYLPQTNYGMFIFLHRKYVLCNWIIYALFVLNVN